LIRRRCRYASCRRRFLCNISKKNCTPPKDDFIERSNLLEKLGGGGRAGIFFGGAGLGGGGFFGGKAGADSSTANGSAPNGSCSFIGLGSIDAPPPQGDVAELPPPNAS